MNKDLFKTNPGNIKSSDAFNDAGGKSYALNDKQAICTYALTGTLHGTFYATDTDQLKKVLELAANVDAEFIAKLAIYSRQSGLMKDIPSLLVAILATKDSTLFKRTFPLVINDGKMLRNFVQTMRSNVVGRKSLGSSSKKMIQKFLTNSSDEQLFRMNVGNDPTLADIIKMVHPKAANQERNALYAYLIEKDYNAEHLLPLISQFEDFKKNMELDIPNVPFQMLTALKLTESHWKKIAANATWNQLRQNLNSFKKHNVFEDKALEATIAAKLENPEEVRRAKIFPYQLFSTYINVEQNVSPRIKIALQKAAEIAIENVPAIEGEVKLLLDVSGSMREPITGQRGSATSKMNCLDVASMFVASVLRKNPTATVIPFDTTVKEINLNPLDSVMTNAQKLSAIGRNGGTDCGCALAHMNTHQMKADAVIFISDNQSCVQSGKTISGETSMMREWSAFKNRNKNSKLLNIDIAPIASTQAYDTKDSLNIAGFSDQVFDVAANFIKNNEVDLVKMVEAVVLPI